MDLDTCSIKLSINVAKSLQVFETSCFIVSFGLGSSYNSIFKPLSRSSIISLTLLSSKSISPWMTLLSFKTSSETYFVSSILGVSKMSGLLGPCKKPLNI